MEILKGEAKSRIIEQLIYHYRKLDGIMPSVVLL